MKTSTAARLKVTRADYEHHPPQTGGSTSIDEIDFEESDTDSSYEEELDEVRRFIQALGP